MSRRVLGELSSQHPSKIAFLVLVVVAEDADNARRQDDDEDENEKTDYGSYDVDIFR